MSDHIMMVILHLFSLVRSHRKCIKLDKYLFKSIIRKTMD